MFRYIKTLIFREIISHCVARYLDDMYYDVDKKTLDLMFNFVNKDFTVTKTFDSQAVDDGSATDLELIDKK